MDKIILVFCSLISCIISVNLLFQFMNERYLKAYDNKILYNFISMGSILVITGVNFFMIPVLNMVVHILLFGIIASFLYSGGRDKKIFRIVEVETMYIMMAIAEAMGMFILDFLLKVLGRTPYSLEILKSMETAFSKMVVLFLYYMVFSRPWKKTELRSRNQYMLYVIMFLYGTINILLISYISEKENFIILIIAVGSIIFCNMYMLYFIQCSFERDEYKLQVMMMEQKEKLQYKNYMAQTEKYQEAMRIIHDENKHIAQMSNLYKENLTEEAKNYHSEISNMLKKFLPTAYTNNPILNCLLSDKAKEAVWLGIQFKVESFTGDLNFMKPIDITTLFGNVLDNAVVAAGECAKDKYVKLSVRAHNSMILIRVENTVNKEIVIKDGELSNKGIGILNIERCLETYEGNIEYSYKDYVLCCDIMLNRIEEVNT